MNDNLPTDNLPDPIFSDIDIYGNNSGGLYYQDVLKTLITQYKLNQDQINVITHQNYIRKFVYRDSKLFYWLQQERENWLLPLYHILILPNNAFRDLDFNDLKAIFESIAPPTNVDDLTMLFGGLSL